MSQNEPCKPRKRRDVATELKVCAACGAVNGADRSVCWLCNETLGAAQRGIPGGPVLQQLAYEPPQRSRPERERPDRTFSLMSLFLVLTIVAVGLGIASVAPGMLVLFLLIVVPALVRTQSAPNSGALGFVGGFFEALGTVILFAMLVFVGACVALFAACWVLCVGSTAWR